MDASPVSDETDRHPAEDAARLGVVHQQRQGQATQCRPQYRQQTEPGKQGRGRREQPHSSPESARQRLYEFGYRKIIGIARQQQTTGRGRMRTGQHQEIDQIADKDHAAAAVEHRRTAMAHRSRSA